MSNINSYDKNEIYKKHPTIPHLYDPKTLEYGVNGKQKVTRFGTDNRNITAGYGYDDFGPYVYGNLNWGNMNLPKSFNSIEAPIGDFSFGTNSQSPNITAMYEPNEVGATLLNTLVSVYEAAQRNAKTFNNRPTLVPQIPNIPMMVE